MIGFDLRKAFSTFATQLLPATCVVCRRTCNNSHNLCHDCEQQLPWMLKACERCAMPLPIHSKVIDSQLRCGACLGRKFDVDGCRALFHYSSPINALISQFKFGARLDIGRCFAHLLSATISEQRGCNQEILIPVPMHYRRFIQRGFNQSWELTKTASALSGIPAHRRLLRKTQHTPAQSKLSSKTERRKNLRNCFAIDKSADLHGVNKITIIDDVVTTMSTVSALARCLKNQGIQRVEVLCIARTGH